MASIGMFNDYFDSVRERVDGHSDGRITATHPNGGERIAAGFQRFASKRFLPSVGYAGAPRYMRNNRSDSP